MSGTAPLTQVLTAVRSGSSTTAEISRRTGLSADVVAAAVHHLTRMGRLEQAPAASSSCPATGCRGCPSGSGADEGAEAGGACTLTPGSANRAGSGTAVPVVLRRP